MVPLIPILCKRAKKFKYLLRDEFITDRAAGSVHGTAAEPGPGTRAVVDTGSKLSISGGNAVISGVTGTADPRYDTGPITRVAGRFVVTKAVNPTTDAVVLSVGFGPAASWFSTAGVYFRKLLGLYFYPEFLVVGPPAVVGTDYDVITVLRSSGCYAFIKGGIYANWTLLYFSDSGSGATKYPGFALIAASAEVCTVGAVRVPNVLWLPTPVAYDTFTRANGALGTSETSGPDAQAVTGRTWVFDAGIWTVDTNQAKGSPTPGSELLTNVEFTTDTSDWTPNHATLTRVDSATDPGSPSGGVDDWCLREDVTGVSPKAVQAETVTVGDWFLASARAYAPSSNTQVRAASLTIGGYAGPFAAVSAEDIWETLVISGRPLLAVSGVLLMARTAGNLATVGDIAYFDMASLKKLTLSSLFASVDDSATGDVVVGADVTLTASTQAGIVMNLDDESSPANFVIAYHDGTNATLDKCVAGVYTSVISAAATYAAGATLVVIKDGNDYSLFYNNAKIGATTAISDAGIVDNTKHGMFSSYSGNRLNDFTVFPRGGGAYSELDKY